MGKGEAWGRTEAAAPLTPGLPLIKHSIMEWISKIGLPKKEKPIDGRLAVRQRFKLDSQYLAPLRKLIVQGFPTKRKGKTPLGRAMSHLVLRATEGEYPDQYVNPAMVRLSEGNTPNPRNIEVARRGKLIEVTFESKSSDLCRFWDDGVLICAYHPTMRIAGINEEPSIRKDGVARIVLPPQLAEQPMHLYLLTHTRDKKSFSRSVYLGEI